MPFSPSPGLGMRFGNFEVLTDSNGKNCLLGGGAFGKTYKARHVFLKRIVALKVLHDRYANDARARERFLREAQAAHELKHPNIADVLDFGETDGSLYYAMEFCSGGDLEQYIKKTRGPVPPLVCLGFARQICKALAYAHGRNFYHRDLKPPNVMLASAEGEPVLKLIDFGLVKMGLGDTEGAAGLTMAGEVLGTPMFASPEQLREEDLDHRSDLFSLGMTLWYLLEGAPPVPGSAITVMAERLGEKSYDKLFSMRVPSAVRPLLSKLLEKNPAKRYQDADALLSALTEVAEKLEKDAGKGVSSALTPPAATDSVIAAAAAPGLGEMMAQAGTSPAASLSHGSATLPASEAAQVDEIHPAPEDAPAATIRNGAGKPPRLQFLKTLGDSVLGEAKLAHDRATDAEILAVRLQDGLDSTDTWPARLAGAAQTVSPRLTADLPLVTQIHDDHPYAVCACPDTVRLVQVLQSRGNLPFLEAAQVLSQIALILDEARESSRRHDLHLNQIYLAPLIANPAETAPIYTLVPLQLEQWPPFLVCVPLRHAQAGMPGHMEDDDPAATGMMTMRSAAVDEFLAPNAAFGGLIYRLITGGEPRSAMYRSKNNYRPIPNLSREGNQLLASCLEGGFNNDTLSHVLEKMMRAEKSSLVPSSSSTRSTAGALSSASALKSASPAIPEKVPTSTSTSTSPTAVPASPAVSTAAPAASNGQPPNLPQEVPRMVPVKPVPPLPPTTPPAKKQDRPTAPTPSARQKAPGIPPIVIVAAVVTVMIFAGVVGAGIIAYNSWRASQQGAQDQPVTPSASQDSESGPGSATASVVPSKETPKTPPPPEISASTSTTPPAPPPQPPAPSAEEMKVEPPPNPKPPKALVFTKGVTPASARVKVNGRSVSLVRNASKQLMLNLEAFSDYPISILVSAPSGYTGQSFLIVDPKSGEYDLAISFKRAKGKITVPANADYEKAELTFLRPLPDEAATLAEEPDSKPSKASEPVGQSSAEFEVPTGIYQVRLISSRKGIEPRVLAADHAVTAGSDTSGFKVPPAWTGAYECQFLVTVNNVTVRCNRILRFDPGLASGKVTEEWNPGAHRHQYPIADIKLDASGVLTGILRTADPKEKSTFDEVVELTRSASGTVSFAFYPVPEATHVKREEFHKTGSVKVLEPGS